MAVAFDAVGPAGGGGAASTTSPVTWAHINSAAGNAILVGINYPTSGSLASAVTYGAVSLSRLGSIDGGPGGSGGFELWGKIGGLPTGSNTVSVTCTPGGNNVTGGSISLTGAATFGTVFTAASAGSTNSISVNVTGTTSGNMIAAGASYGNPTGALTATSPGVTRWAVFGDTNTAADNTVGGTWASPGGTQAVAFQSALTPDWWGEVAVEVQGAPGGGILGQALAGKTWRRHFWHPQQSIPQPATPTVTTGPVIPSTPPRDPRPPIGRWLRRAFIGRPPLVGQAPPQPLVPTTPARRRPTLLRRPFVARVPLVGQAPPQPLVPAPAPRHARPVLQRRGRSTQVPGTPTVFPPVSDQRRALLPPFLRRGRSTQVPGAPAGFPPVSDQRRALLPPFLRRARVAQVPPAVVVVPGTQALPPQPGPRHARPTILRRTFVGRPPLVGQAAPQPLVPTALARRRPVGPWLRRTFVGRPPLVGQAPPGPVVYQPVRDRLFWFPRPRGRFYGPVQVQAPTTAQALPPQQPVRRIQLRVRPWRRLDDTPAIIGRPLLSGDDTSFEGGLGGWVAIGAATLATSTTQAAQGVQSLKVTLPAAANAGARTPGNNPVKSCQPGDTVRVTGWVFSETSARSLSVNIGWQTVNGSTAAPSTTNNLGTPSVGAWVPFSVQVVVPSAPGLAKLLVDIAFGAGTVNDVVYLDAIDIRVRSHVDVQWPYIGWPASNQPGQHRAQPVARMLRRGRHAAPPLVAPAVTTQVPPPQSWRRLVHPETFLSRLRRRLDDTQAIIGTPLLFGDDTSFEGGVGNWIGIGGTPPTLTTSGTQAAQGVQSLKVTLNTAASNTGIRHPNTVNKFVQPGDTIRLSGWIYAETTARTVSINFLWVRTDNNSAAPQFIQGLGTIATGTWTPFSVQTVAPSSPGLTKVSVDVTIGAGSSGDVFYFDALDLRVRSHVAAQFPPVGWPASNQGILRRLLPRDRMLRRGRHAAPPLVGAQPVLPPQVGAAPRRDRVRFLHWFARRGKSASTAPWPPPSPFTAATSVSTATAGHDSTPGVSGIGPTSTVGGPHSTDAVTDPKHSNSTVTD